MALNQEFWLQQKRREAERLGLTVPPNAGAAAVPAVNAPPMANAMVPPRPVMPRPGVAPHGGCGGCGGCGMGSAMGGPMGPMASVAGAALQAMGLPWAPPKRQVMSGAAAVEQQHKDWNSDDEEIDEFGRKKRRKVTAKASSQSKASKEEAESKDGKEKAAKDSKSSGSSKLSEKQKAALERLRERALKPPPKDEPKDELPGEGEAKVVGAGEHASSPQADHPQGGQMQELLMAAQAAAFATASAHMQEEAMLAAANAAAVNAAAANMAAATAAAVNAATAMAEAPPQMSAGGPGCAPTETWGEETPWDASWDPSWGAAALQGAGAGTAAACAAGGACGGGAWPEAATDAAWAPMPGSNNTWTDDSAWGNSSNGSNGWGDGGDGWGDGWPNWDSKRWNKGAWGPMTAWKGKGGLPW